MSGIKNFDKSSIDFSKISTTASGAKNGEYVNVDSVHQQYWGDTEELTFEEFDDGSVLIREGDTAMGWTTIDAIKTENVSNGKSQADELRDFREYESATAPSDGRPGQSTSVSERQSTGRNLNERQFSGTRFSQSNGDASSNSTKMSNNIIANEGLPDGPNYRAPHRNEYNGNNSKY